MIEEAPCPFLSQETRNQMTEAALRLAKEVGYSGVGTLEFLVDDDQNFYFLEMNTRLQVEHPVTEMITGLDLVRIQIEIGEGKKLSVKQEDLRINGCAFEARLYAEDPENNFFPSPGKIQWLSIPEGPGVRHDSAVYAGYQIPIFYDPMIAKLVVWGKDRKEAISRMQRALLEYQVGGFKNNIPFLRNLIESPDVVAGKMHTRFIDEHPELLEPRKISIPQGLVAGIAALAKTKQASVSGNTEAPSSSVSLWKQAGMRETLNRL